MTLAGHCLSFLSSQRTHGDDLSLRHAGRGPAPLCREAHTGYLQVCPGNAFSYRLNVVELFEDLAVRRPAAFRPMHVDAQPEPSVPPF